jgi:hypothetical protein
MGRGRGQLLLLDPNPLVTDTLVTACVDNLLPIVRSEDEAHAALTSCTTGPMVFSNMDGRNLAPVPLQLADPSYGQQRERLKDGLRKAGMPD